MIPTEHEGTVAVDAAARHRWDNEVRPFVRTAQGIDLPTFDELGPLEKNQQREIVLPGVWAALEALPDRGPMALREAAAAARFGVAGPEWAEPVALWLEDRAERAGMTASSTDDGPTREDG